MWTVGGTGLLTLKIWLKIKLLILALRHLSGGIESGSLTLGPRLLFRNGGKRGLLLEAFCLMGTYNPLESKAAFHLDPTGRANCPSSL